MSELKAIESATAVIEKVYLVYRKSEADAVLEEKDRAITELKKEKEYVIENTAEVINAQEREIRHQKYKRCLAMADKCVDLCHKAKDLYRWAEDENLEHHYNHKIEFFARWYKRWLELAEKFKEGV